MSEKNTWVIWGANFLGRYAAQQLQREGFRVAAVIDKDEKKQGTTMDEIPVVSQEQAQSRFDVKSVCLLITVMNTKNYFQIMEQVEIFRCSNVAIIKPRARKFGLKLNPWADDKSEIIWIVRDGKKRNVIPRLEINLIDSCNLNCKACSHFSSIFDKDSIYKLEDYRKDLNKLRNAGVLVRLRLLGGEPLLLKNLDQYMEVAREIFPEADIEVITNGLLIPRLETKVIRAFRENEISLIISRYPPTVRVQEQIEERLNENGLMWCFDGEEITQFARVLTLQGVHNAKISSDNCMQPGCTFLRQGRIFKCPYEGLIGELSKYYKLQKEICFEGAEIVTEGEALYETLKQIALEPVEMCKYCSENMEWIEWGVEANPVLEDWLYEGKADAEKKLIST